MLAYCMLLYIDSALHHQAMGLCKLLRLSLLALQPAQGQPDVAHNATDVQMTWFHFTLLAPTSTCAWHANIRQCRVRGSCSEKLFWQSAYATEVPCGGFGLHLVGSLLVDWAHGVQQEQHVVQQALDQDLKVST